MKLKKLLSVITATALSVTMCLSMNLTASATEVTDNPYLSGDNGFSIVNSEININTEYTFKEDIKLSDLVLTYDFNMSDADKSAEKISEVYFAAKKSPDYQNIKSIVQTDITDNKLTITFNSDDTYTTSSVIKFQISVRKPDYVFYTQTPTLNDVKIEKSDIRTTTVKATTQIPEPTYTVIIPATIKFDDVTACLEKYRDKPTDKAGKDVVVAQPFDITASGVNYLFHDDLTYDSTITLSVLYNGEMTGTTSSENKLPYTISKTAPITAGTKTSVGTFTNDVDLLAGEENKITLTASLNRADIKVSDTYTDTVTFSIERTKLEV